MAGRDALETPKPPVALGCFFAISVVVGLVGLVSFAIVFLESGADTGEVELEAADGYAPGSAEFVGEQNFYLVRLPDGSFLAVDDMDRRNRQSQGARCRVALVALEEAANGTTPAQLRSRISPEAAGSTSVLRETCFGAVYDIAGVLLTGDGPNLDRFSVAVNASGRVVVDRSKRACSVREGNTWAAPADC